MVRPMRAPGVKAWELEDPCAPRDGRAAAGIAPLTESTSGSLPAGAGPTRLAQFTPAGTATRSCPRHTSTRPSSTATPTRSLWTETLNFVPTTTMT
jgi:hypothetical protein